MGVEGDGQDDRPSADEPVLVFPTTVPDDPVTLGEGAPYAAQEVPDLKPDGLLAKAGKAVLKYLGSGKVEQE